MLNGIKNRLILAIWGQPVQRTRFVAREVEDGFILIATQAELRRQQRMLENERLERELEQEYNALLAQPHPGHDPIDAEDEAFAELERLAALELEQEIQENPMLREAQEYNDAIARAFRI